jgi:alcohol dehydrogenase class IV
MEALIPSGQSVAVLVSGSVERIAGPALGLSELAARCHVTRLPGVGPDAPLPELEAALRVLRPAKANLILAIGGGSTLDAAKALSVMVNAGDVRELFFGKEKLPECKIPLLAVPTTAGSGAETSHAAILFDPLTGVKGGLRGGILQPERVVIDTSLYLFAPASLLAESGFDALTHAVETAVSKASNPVVYWQSVAAIRILLEKLPQVVEKRCPYAMNAVALAAMQMGINLANSSTCLPHRIQYALRRRIPVSHASCLVMLYAGWLGLWRRKQGLTAMDELAASLGCTKQGLIEQINMLKLRLGLGQRLTDHGLTVSDLSAISKDVTGRLDLDPLYTDRQTIEEILVGSL